MASRGDDAALLRGVLRDSEAARSLIGKDRTWSEALRSPEVLQRLLRAAQDDQIVQSTVDPKVLVPSVDDAESEYFLSPHARGLLAEEMRQHGRLAAAGAPSDNTEEEDRADAAALTLSLYTCAPYRPVLSRRVKFVRGVHLLAVDASHDELGAAPLTLRSSDRAASVGEAFGHFAAQVDSCLTGEDPVALGARLRSARTLAAPLTALSLYAGWAPPTGAGAVPVAISRRQVQASQTSAGTAPAAAVTQDASVWSASLLHADVHWHARLRTSVPLCCVRVEWSGSRVPRVLEVLVGEEGSEDLSRVHVRVVRDEERVTVVRFRPTLASVLALRFYGYAGANTARLVGIRLLAAYRAAEQDPTAPGWNPLQHRVRAWSGALRRAYGSRVVPHALRPLSLALLVRMAAASGSLHAWLEVAAALMSSAHPALARDEEPHVLYALRLLAGEAEALAGRALDASDEGEDEQADAGLIMGPGVEFSRRLSRGEIEFHGGSRVVRGRGNAIAVVDSPMTRGVWAWEFLVQQDKAGDESTCFGAAAAPLDTERYQQSRQVWLLRAYNGKLYGPGTVANSELRVHAGDVVRCVADLDYGTMRVAINGKDEGEVFRDPNLRNRSPLYPAVAFYGKDGIVAFLGMRNLGSSAGKTAARRAAMAPPLAEGADPLAQAYRALDADAGADAIGAASPLEWACPACTFLNQPVAPTCSVCGASRPAEGAATGVAAPVGGDGSDGDYEWVCATCTFHNAAALTECSMCTAPRPGDPSWVRSASALGAEDAAAAAPHAAAAGAAAEGPGDGDGADEDGDEDVAAGAGAGDGDGDGDSDSGGAPPPLPRESPPAPARASVLGGGAAVLAGGRGGAPWSPDVVEEEDGAGERGVAPAEAVGGASKDAVAEELASMGLGAPSSAAFALLSALADLSTRMPIPWREGQTEAPFVVELTDPCIRACAALSSTLLRRSHGASQGGAVPRRECEVGGRVLGCDAASGARAALAILQRQLRAVQDSGLRPSSLAVRLDGAMESVRDVLFDAVNAEAMDPASRSAAADALAAGLAVLVPTADERAAVIGEEVGLATAALAAGDAAVAAYAPRRSMLCGMLHQMVGMETPLPAATADALLRLAADEAANLAREAARLGSAPSPERAMLLRSLSTALCAHQSLLLGRFEALRCAADRAREAFQRTRDQMAAESAGIRAHGSSSAAAAAAAEAAAQQVEAALLAAGRAPPRRREAAAKVADKGKGEGGGGKGPGRASFADRHAWTLAALPKGLRAHAERALRAQEETVAAHAGVWRFASPLAAACVAALERAGEVLRARRGDAGVAAGVDRVLMSSVVGRVLPSLVAALWPVSGSLHAAGSMLPALVGVAAAVAEVARDLPSAARAEEAYLSKQSTWRLNLSETAPTEITAMLQRLDEASADMGRAHWAVDLLKAVATVGGAMAATCVAGAPVGPVERDLDAVLGMAALRGGLRPARCAVLRDGGVAADERTVARDDFAAAFSWDLQAARARVDRCLDEGIAAASAASAAGANNATNNNDDADDDAGAGVGRESSLMPRDAMERALVRALLGPGPRPPRGAGREPDATTASGRGAGPAARVGSNDVVAPSPSLPWLGGSRGATGRLLAFRLQDVDGAAASLPRERVLTTVLQAAGPGMAWMEWLAKLKPENKLLARRQGTFPAAEHATAAALLNVTGLWAVASESVEKALATGAPPPGSPPPALKPVWMAVRDVRQWLRVRRQQYQSGRLPPRDEDAPTGAGEDGGGRGAPADAGVEEVKTGDQEPTVVGEDVPGASGSGTAGAAGEGPGAAAGGGRGGAMAAAADEAADRVGAMRDEVERRRRERLGRLRRMGLRGATPVTFDECLAATVDRALLLASCAPAVPAAGAAPEGAGREEAERACAEARVFIASLGPDTAPFVVHRLLERRAQRALQRSFGVDALRELLRASLRARVTTAAVDALAQVRPAFRGRRAPDLPVVGARHWPFDARGSGEGGARRSGGAGGGGDGWDGGGAGDDGDEQRRPHHCLAALDGAPVRACVMLRARFARLLAEMVALLHVGTVESHLALSHVVMWCCALQYRPEDFAMLQHVGLLPLLQRAFSLHVPSAAGAAHLAARPTGDALLARAAISSAVSVGEPPRGVPGGGLEEEEDEDEDADDGDEEREEEEALALVGASQVDADEAAKAAAELLEDVVPSPDVQIGEDARSLRRCALALFRIVTAHCLSSDGARSAASASSLRGQLVSVISRELRLAALALARGYLGRFSPSGEAMEAEEACFLTLVFLQSALHRGIALQRLSSLVPALLGLLPVGSPRVQRLALRALGELMPARDPVVGGGDAWGPFASARVAVRWLMQRAGTGVCVAEGRSLHPAHAQEADIQRCVDATLMPDTQAGPPCRMPWVAAPGAGSACASVGGATVALLRRLQQRSRPSAGAGVGAGAGDYGAAWAELVVGEVRAAMLELVRDGRLHQLEPAASGPGRERAGSRQGEGEEEADAALHAVCCTAAGALGVLGGVRDVLRVGGRVTVSPGLRAAMAKDLDAAASSSQRGREVLVRAVLAGRPEGRVVEFSRGRAFLSVRFDVDGRVHDVAADDVVALDEVPPATAALTVDDDLIGCMVSLLRTANAAPAAAGAGAGVAGAPSGAEERAAPATARQQWCAALGAALTDALSVVVQQSAATAALVAGGELGAELVRAALQASPLPRFVSASGLLLRASIQRELLMEALSVSLNLAGGDGGDGEGGEGGAGEGVNGGGGAGPGPRRPMPRKLTGEERRREEVASRLHEMLGMEQRLCVRALKRCNDNPDQAAEWLLSPDAQAYVSSGQMAREEEQEAAAERELAEAAAAAGLAVGAAGAVGGAGAGVGGGPGGGEAMRVARAMVERRRVAREMVDVTGGMPVRLCELALLQCGDRKDAAIMWLLQEGSKYAAVAAAEEHEEAHGRLRLADTFSEATPEAVLEGVEDDGVRAEGGLGVGGDAGDEAVSPFALLGAPEALLEELPTASDALRAYVRRGMLLRVTEVSGQVARVVGRGALGVEAVERAGSAAVKVHLFDGERGTAQLYTVAPSGLRVHAQLLGAPVSGTADVRGLDLLSSRALQAVGARRAVVALLRSWPREDRERGMGPLAAVGGSEKLMQLVKLVAASEGGFATSLMDASAAGAVQAAEGADAVVDEDEEGADGAAAAAAAAAGTGHGSGVAIAAAGFSAGAGVEGACAGVRTVGSLEEPLLDPASPLLPSLRGVLHGLLEQEQAAGGGAGARAGPLLEELVAQCVRHMLESTAAPTEARRAIQDSLHPLPGGARVEGAMAVAGGGPLRVQFDSRTALGRGGRLELFADAGRRRRVASFGEKDAVHPVVVHGSAVYWRLSTEPSAESAGAWGFKMVASPVRGLSWRREDEVASAPSLEWACWVLAFVLSDAAPFLPRGSVHNLQVFLALFSYLESRGTPHKHRVAQLLTHLLRHPDLFPPEERPDLAPMLAVEAQVAGRIRHWRSRDVVFLPPRLLQLLELAGVARRAMRYFASGSVAPMRPLPLRFRRSTALFQRQVVLEPRLEAAVAAAPESMAEAELVDSVMEVAEALLLRARMPDPFLCEAFQVSTGASVSQRPKRERVERALHDMGPWTFAMDAQLVQLANELAQRAKKQMRDLEPREVVVEGRWAFRYQALSSVPREALQLRFALLSRFNARLERVIELVDLTESAPHPESLPARLRALSHCVFRDTKLALLKRALAATQHPGACNVQLMLDNNLAFDSMERGVTSLSRSACIFAQAFRALRAVPARSLCAQLDDKGRLFSVKFRGEEGIDWGGIYREVLQRMATDLFSPQFELFMLCPNGAAGDGMNTDKYIPRPSLTSPFALEMFEFVGRLMGISLRQDAYLPFALAPGVWKQLVGDPGPWADLASYDAAAAASLKAMRGCDRNGVADDAAFADAFEGLRFVTQGSDGAYHELLPGGADIAVTLANRHEYCDLVEAFRARECHAATEAMRRGLSSMVPARALQLFTAAELELQVCGDATVDVELLREHTSYHGDGFGPSHPMARRFWRVMESLSNDDRAQFIRFVWGRSRLPAPRDWDKKFKLTKHNGGDSQLPIAHTCFFQVEMPCYSSDDIMRQRVLTAIHYGLGQFAIA